MLLLMVKPSSGDLSRNLAVVQVKKFNVVEINISCHDAMYSLSRPDFIYLNEKGEILCDFVRTADLER